MTFSGRPEDGYSLIGLKSLVSGVEYLSPKGKGLFEIDLVDNSGSLLTISNLSPNYKAGTIVTPGTDSVRVVFYGLLEGCLNFEVSLTTKTNLPFVVPAAAVRWGYSGNITCPGRYSPRETRITAFTSLAIPDQTTTAEPRLWVPHGFGASGPVPKTRVQMK